MLVSIAPRLTVIPTAVPAVFAGTEWSKLSFFAY